MEQLYSCCYAAICAVILGLLLKKLYPEISSVISALAMVACFSVAVGYIAVIRDFVYSVSENMTLPNGAVETVFNVISVGFVSKICSELCRNSGEASLAASVEILGGCAAVISSVPLWSGVSEILLSFL